MKQFSSVIVWNYPLAQELLTLHFVNKFIENLAQLKKNMEGLEMTKKIFIILLAGVFVLGLFSLAQAGKPQDGDGVFFGNGFPSGPHFNLNIKAKKDDFTCPDANDVMKGYCPDDQKVTVGRELGLGH